MAQSFKNANLKCDANWFEDWFDEDYLKLYSNRNDNEAEEAVKTALRMAPDLADGIVLDLGCGTGRHLSALRQVNQNAFGIDLSRTMLRHAKNDLIGSLIRADMRCLPIADSKLDAVCLWFTPFGYFSQKENAALFQNLANLIKSGGILLVDFFNSTYVLSSHKLEERIELDGALIQINRVVNRERIEKRIKITCGNRDRCITESVQLYTPTELRNLIGDSGFKFMKCWGDYAGGEFHADTSMRFISVWRCGV
ncbi:MAG: class I SAM-dependent methyltransferase [Holophagales bacterium]|jgi:SAM-dependent methyltransferase|nr:class I SAM-dependent methyltransferase [Holophagales bacterium]